MRALVFCGLMVSVACAAPVAQGIWGRVRVGDERSYVSGVTICAAGPETPDLTHEWHPATDTACSTSDSDGRFVLALDAGAYRLCQVLENDDSRRLPCDCELVHVERGRARERNRSLHPVGGGWSGADLPACVGRDKEMYEQFDPMRYRRERDAGQPSSAASP